MEKTIQRAISVAPETAARLRGSVAAGPLQLSEKPSLEEIGQAVQAIATSFEQFKGTVVDAAKEAAKGEVDVLTKEKVDRINEGVTDAQAKLDDLSEKAGRVAALEERMEHLQLNAGGGARISPEARAYNAAFETWFRKGTGEAELRAMQPQNAARTGDEESGGVLVGEEMEAGIERVAAQASTIRSLATVRRIGGSIYKKLVNKGGATAGWVNEEEERTETDGAKLSELAFSTMELYAMPAATQALLDDAVLDIAAWIGSEVEIAFAEQEGEAFITGDGAGKPRGILGYPTVADANYAWGKVGFIKSGASGGFPATAGGIGLDPSSLIDLQTALKKAYSVNASWVMSRKTQGETRKMRDETGSFIWQPGLKLGEPAVLLGKPVETDDYMPDPAANSFSIAYGDFRRGYLVIDRAGIRVLRDNLTQKPYVLFYTTKRVGGGIQNFEAIKLMKFAA